VQYFCPKCGLVITSKDLEFYKNHFLCRTCHSQEVEDFQIKKQYTIYVCSECASYIFDRNPQNSLWKRTESDNTNAIFTEILYKEIIEPLNQKSDDEFKINHAPLLDIPCTITAFVFNSRNIQNEITVIVKQSLCKSCNKMISKRFDAVIQMRTLKLKSQKPKLILGPLIQEVIAHVSNIQQRHPDQYISDIEDVSQGFDLKLSNKAVMGAIQSFLTNKYPFIIKSSKKLMGKNSSTGGDLYRTYILLRLIPFHAFSVIRIKNDTYIVKKIYANRIQLENLSTHNNQTHNFDFFERFLIEILEE